MCSVNAIASRLNGLSRDGVAAGSEPHIRTESFLSSPHTRYEVPTRNGPQFRSAACDRRRAVAKASRPNPPMCPYAIRFSDTCGTPSRLLNDAACMSRAEAWAPIRALNTSRKRPEETTATIQLKTRGGTAWIVQPRRR